MERFTLAAVRPLVREATVEGRSLRVAFRCPKSGNRVDAVWAAHPIGISGLATTARGTTRYQVRSQVNALVRQMFGYGHIGRIGRQLAEATLATDQTQLSTSEEERGLVEAFRSVSTQFAWVDGRWLHASCVGQAPDPVVDEVWSVPLTAYDKSVACRMMVAIAGTHGGVSDEEAMFLAEVYEGSLEGLLARPALTAAELAETSRGAPRRAIMEVAWSMAFSDEQFDPAEEALLERFGVQLGFDLEERVELKRRAQMYVIEQYMERVFTFGAHDETARLQLYGLSDRIGVSRGAVERAEARFQRRHLG